MIRRETLEKREIEVWENKDEVWYKLQKFVKYKKEGILRESRYIDPSRKKKKGQANGRELN